MLSKHREFGSGNVFMVANTSKTYASIQSALISGNTGNTSSLCELSFLQFIFPLTMGQLCADWVILKQFRITGTTLESFSASTHFLLPFKALVQKRLERRLLLNSLLFFHLHCSDRRSQLRTWCAAQPMKDWILIYYACHVPKCSAYLYCALWGRDHHFKSGNRRSWRGQRTWISC